jgi:cell wall-associated NlpC family hydrolase
VPALSPAAPVRQFIPARRLVVVLLATFLTATLFAAPAHALSATSLSTPANKTVTMGTAATITTRLTSGGVAVAGRPVTLYTYILGTWRTRGTVTTSATGYATFRYAPTASRTVAVRFPGDSRYAASRSADFKVYVTTPSSLNQAALNEAVKHLRKDYNWGSSGPYRFDCSGFTLYVFGRLGRRLPHNSAQQYGVVRRIDKASKRPGDLIFFRNSSGSIDHVGIYAGGSYVYAASRAADTVKKQYIYTSRYSVGRVS